MFKKNKNQSLRFWDKKKKFVRKYSEKKVVPLIEDTKYHFDS